MPTLDSFFPENATRGDGRKFTHNEWKQYSWFMPIFKDVRGIWVGIEDNGNYFADKYLTYSDGWNEWTPTKKTKKITLYKPIFRSDYDDQYTVPDHCEWHTDKDNWGKDEEIVGWLTQQAEVEE